MEENIDPMENFQVDAIFKQDDIDEILSAPSATGFIFDLIEAHLKKTTGITEYDSNLLMLQAEFHLNNLIYLKDNYKSFPNLILAKLLNLLSILLNLREETYNEYLPTKGNIDEEENKNSTVPEPDFATICKRKLNEIKKGLQLLKLVPSKTTESNFVLDMLKKKEKQSNEVEYYLSKTELSMLLDYINTFYLPFIRLFYHFINIERITENKNIEVIINRPLPVPPLSLAVSQKQELNIFEDQNVSEDNDEVKEIVKRNHLYLYI